MIPVPTARQLAWQDAEVGLFIHFNMFTFDGTGDCRERLPGPDVFAPARLDTDQWIEAAKAIGARYAVLTVKHGEGFCLWPTDAYPYSVKQSSWRGGQGDVVGDFVRSCRAAGIEPGIYCSADFNTYCGCRGHGRVLSGDPGDQARFTEIVETLLTELWTRYGSIFEIWFDGGALPIDEGGPDIGRLLAQHQPDANVFQTPWATFRWVGNEDGVAPYPCWATAASADSVGGGDPDGGFWRPGECDVPLRGDVWGWNPDQEHLIRPLDNLMKLYYASVGRNCNLLLNSTPDRDGLIPEPDMQRYREFGAEVARRFGRPVVEAAGEGDIVTLTTPGGSVVDTVVIMEDIRCGERVRAYVVEGRASGEAWHPLCEGVSIGHKRIQEFPAVAVEQIRLRVTASVGAPAIRRFALFHTGAAG